MDTSPEEKAKIKEKIEKLKASKFKQQTLPAWRPVPTALSTMLTFTAFSIFFLVIGALLFVMSGDIIEESVQYNENCYPTDNWYTSAQRNIFPLGTKFQTTSIKWCSEEKNIIHIEKDIPGKIFLYYQLDNFYQNHRRYVKSRSNTQLDGGGDGKKLMTAAEVKSDCDPVYSNSNLWENQKYSYDKLKTFTGPGSMVSDVKPDLLPGDAATPCGLIAKSLFNDTYRIRYSADKTALLVKNAGTLQPVSHKNIAWESDVQYKFKNTPQMSKQWWDMTDEHFIVWMRTAGLPNFRKLWGSMENVKAGYYMIDVNNQFNVKPYDGQKYFVMSTTNSLGGKNYFLAICYICVGVFCAIFALVFLIVYFKRQGQQD